MKLDKETQLPEALRELLGVIMSADHVEVISVPNGSTIEEEMAKRGYREDKEPKLNQAEWPYPGAEADKRATDEANAEGDKEEGAVYREKQRQMALKIVRKRQASLLEALDIYKAMEKSIMRQEKERTSTDQLNELVMMMKLKVLGL